MRTPTLRITMLQTALHWENRKENLAMFGKMIGTLPKGNDLILLPEMFSTGFSMKPGQFAETMDGEVLNWMAATAATTGSALCGSVMMREKENYFNRLIWMNPDGNFFQYDKRHLFALGEENKHYRAGNQKLIVELRGWKICPLICYDLRFPVWCRNAENYDVLVFVANWPTRRIQAWNQLLVARAIENQCYVAAVNRVGSDGNGMEHNGCSQFVDAAGTVIQKSMNEETALTLDLSSELLLRHRNQFPFLQTADTFRLEL
jgi:predicted amidohydrolase